MPYTVKRSLRARQIRLQVGAGGSVVVTAPLRLPESRIVHFVNMHAAWIEAAVTRMRDRKALPVRGRGAYLQHKEVARRSVIVRIKKWNMQYGFKYGRVAIKDTSSLWGSCSRKGNLNFSYKIIFLSEELQDYIVVHELCHLQEPNHSRAFWVLVAQTQPRYRELRTELKKYLLR